MGAMMVEMGTRTRRFMGSRPCRKVLPLVLARGTRPGNTCRRLNCALSNRSGDDQGPERPKQTPGGPTTTRRRESRREAGGGGIDRDHGGMAADVGIEALVEEAAEVNQSLSRQGDQGAQGRGPGRGRGRGRNRSRREARSRQAIRANVSGVLRAKIKKAKTSDKVWGILLRHERNMSVSLVCLAAVRLRRLSKRRNTSDNGRVRSRGERVLVSLVRRRLPSMNTKHVATILHSMAALRLSVDDGDLAASLIDRFVLLVDGANGQAIGNMVWACGKLGRFPDKESLERILRRLLSVSGECNSQNFSNTLWALGTMAEQGRGDVVSDPTLELLLSCYVCKLSESVPQGMSNVLWALARLGYEPGGDVVQRIVRELLSRPRDQMKPQDLANALWSLGRLRCDVGVEDLAALASSSVEMIETFNPQELSLTLWGLARTDPSLLHDDEYARILRAVVAKCHTFNAQALSTTLWAVGKIGRVPPPDHMYSLTEAVLTRLGRFTPQGLSNVLWAMTSLSYSPGPVALREISAEVSRKAKRIPGKSLASIMKSFALLQYTPADAAMRGINDAFLMQLPDCAPQSLCLLLWSYASLGQSPGTRVLDELHARCWELLPECTVAQQANQLWCYATLSYDPGQDFVTELSSRFASSLDEASPQSIANLVWAVASLGYALGNVQEAALVMEILRRCQRSEFSGQELTNLVWALAVMGAGGDGFSDVWGRAADAVMSAGEAKGRQKQLAQLFHSKLLLRGDYALPGDLGNEAEGAWREIVSSKEPVLSRFHHQVSACLGRLGVHHDCEVYTQNGYLSVDILLEGAGGSKVVVEVDGPSHFSSNTLKTNGSTLTRNELLRRWGYDLVSVPFFKWPAEEGNQDAFMRKALGCVL